MSRQFILDRIRRYGTFYNSDGYQLKCGERSPWLFDLSTLARYPAGMIALGQLLKPYVENSDIVGGNGAGADMLAAAVVSTTNKHLTWVTVRDTPKGRGLDLGYISGCRYPEVNMTLVEDVVTSGDTVLEAYRNAKDSGVHVKNVVILLDREEEFANDLSELIDVPVYSIFTKSEVLSL